eukprot:1919265-Amphidinium_carterae.1
MWGWLPGCRQSVFRAELLAVVHALEECNPRRLVSDCKGVVKALQAIQSGQRQPKGRHRDLEVRARNALTQACQLHWVKAHQTRQVVDEGRITLEDFQGNQEAEEWPTLVLLLMLSMSPLLSTFVGSLWLRRSEFFGFW